MSQHSACSAAGGSAPHDARIGLSKRLLAPTDCNIFERGPAESQGLAFFICTFQFRSVLRRRGSGEINETGTSVTETDTIVTFRNSGSKTLTEPCHRHPQSSPPQRANFAQIMTPPCPTHWASRSSRQSSAICFGLIQLGVVAGAISGLLALLLGKPLWVVLATYAGSGLCVVLVLAIALVSLQKRNSG